MDPGPKPVPHDSPAAAAEHQLVALACTALSLRGAALSAAVRPLLQGSHYAILRGADAPDSAARRLIRTAATELGAQVADIEPGLSRTSSSQELRRTAHLLNQLYDAVMCDGLDHDLVARLETVATIPVHDRLTAPDHPVGKAARLLDGMASADDNLRYTVQALLVTQRG